ncbi:ribosome biogenesis GTP-binding protein YsxC [Caldimicrobium thiodismutans]|jgi:GTP-binding protein|uniref:Probable GTP-binding protein EngB n=1 Tax=Caldimicrobium thiodismutans TaxID=1653476 RepID=A0A0U4N280_9BACT|nr:ribosome biogenesis GTP-binding protein YihA/YsxC [Caldimicrobium thiodismutans]BAU23366.1 ribosome biogenesis GTP-binding protein YsxC [Caldimicrobium thiodismutans]
MFKRAEFVKSVYKLEDLPPPEYPEIVILGRSNAGKSSFINALFNTRKLARVSSTPGFTQALNFFLIDGRFLMVDLPGYGFAKVSKEVYLNWQKLIEGYLQSIRDFRLLILIFDIRRKPDPLDRALIKFIKALNKPFIVVLNKIDTLSKGELEAQKNIYLKELSLPEKIIFPLSCKEKRGFEALKRFILHIFKT